MGSDDLEVCVLIHYRGVSVGPDRFGTETRTPQRFGWPGGGVEVEVIEIDVAVHVHPQCVLAGRYRDIIEGQILPCLPRARAGVWNTLPTGGLLPILRNEAFWYAYAPLESQTVYRVTIQGTYVGGLDLSWTFTTE